MRTTILMAGLLAGLTGTAVLAQTTTAPETDSNAQATAPAQTAQPAEVGATDIGPRRDGGRMGVPGLAPLELHDADGNGTITQEEIETGRTQRFAAADADGDGALSPEELIALEEAIREEMRQAQATARATAVITRMDDNGDGLLQAEELAARTPQLAPIFDELDTDNDGGISQAEHEAGRSERGVREGFGRGGRDPGQAKFQASRSERGGDREGFGRDGHDRGEGLRGGLGGAMGRPLGD